MASSVSWRVALLWIWACSDSAAPPASTPNAPAEPTAPQTPPPSAPPTPIQPGLANPCDNPAPITLDLSAGVMERTPWGLDVNYILDEDKKRGPGFMFQLRSGERRWETRRDNTNWTRPLTWRGFCWRGAERPERRALRVKIRVAPVCKDGKLQELGGCGTALGAS